MKEKIVALKGQALSDAMWVQGFGAGTPWLDGRNSGFRERRLAELKDAGVFMPHPDKQGQLIVGDFHLIEAE